jgi:HD-GYP domain-containing protein (c-di-GMP phosphodiesterase class II)
MVSAPEVDPQLESLLRSAKSRAAAPLAGADRRAEAISAALLVLAIAGLAIWMPGTRHLSLETAAMLLLGLVAASGVRFSLGASTGSPTEPLLIASLLLLPPAAAVVLVVVADVCVRLPDYVCRRTHPDHLLLHFGDAWHAVGPALIAGALVTGPPGLHSLPILVAALAAQVAVDSSAFAARAWLAHGMPPQLQLRAAAISFLLDAALAPLGLLVAVAAHAEPLAVLLLLPLIGLIALLGGEREKRLEQSVALSDAYRGTALLMGDMLELGDPYTGGEHSWGVVALVLQVGEALGLDAREQRRLEFAALLHDIGKLRVPREILNKAGGLTEEEWEIVRRHPADGQQMLERVGGMLGEIAPAVRAHHERWDGRGYPDGLKAEEIPLAARIICACDAFNAMTTTRPYRPAMPVADALTELRACAGRQFDVQVVDAILELHHERTEPVVAQLGTLTLGRSTTPPAPLGTPLAAPPVRP